ncbi:hypothetical protein C9374_004789 [Naegleria lovaniensis]|uniref:DUF676 domain-containing protein n=1 Tax=Naegleria lovaniensis TaxID=51637 RepID=A0AA88GR72_NAELO|nr:uncharacterized protein C9374_004789 [Naegleria lovaniensis]KAG2382822.1 hypothetical protein C9374_004789 [Naegleria lovaniensis]
MYTDDDLETRLKSLLLNQTTTGNGNDENNIISEENNNDQESTMQYHVAETHHPEQLNISATTTTTSDLFVLIHGLHGSAEDFHYISQRLKSMYENKDAIIIDCSCNEGKTHDGIEALGRNVMCEVLQVLYERNVNLSVNKKMKLTVVGHSLGGLIARYLVKLMLAFNENSEEDSSIFTAEENGESVKLHYQHFKEHVLPFLLPCSFVTISTPHLGVRKPGNGFFRAAYRFAAHTFMSLLGKTGKELKLEDADDIESSLLFRMSVPGSDFVNALLKFPNRTLIAACHLDGTVPYPSAAIRSFNPYALSSYGVPSLKIGGICPTLLASTSHLDLLKEFFTTSSVAIASTTSTTTSTASTEDSSSQTYIETLQTLSWRGTEHDRYDGEVNDETRDLYRDNLYLVEYPKKMLHNLQDIGWRRIDLDFTVASSLQGREVHVIVVNKKRPISFGGYAEELEVCGNRCVEIVSLLCQYDAEHFKE